MRSMNAAAALRPSPPLHQARSFARAPGQVMALTLLTEMASAPCAYSPVAADRPLALYGAGNLGRLAREFLAAVGKDVAMVVDRDAKRLARDPYWSGVKLVEPGSVDDAAKKDFRLAVCVVTAPYVPLERSLQELGFTDIVPFFDLAESFRSVHPLSNGWFAKPLTAVDQMRTADVLARWDDEVSRAHHLQFMAWRRLREEWSFDGAPVPQCARFFIPEVTDVIGENEFLLDAGAHFGSASEAFIKLTRGAFGEIAAFEPDAANRAIFKNNMQAWLPDDLRVRVYDDALAEAEGEATFHDGLGYASQLSPTGLTSVTTRPLDALRLAPTFIKLHLEGAELPALMGARETLLAHRPIVAATVYHNADGVWKMPYWLMETLPDYRFLFRAHAWCGNGAVVYAIPNERTA